jgi:hypothetical protein
MISSPFFQSKTKPSEKKINKIYLFISLSSVAYQYDTSDWKNKRIGLLPAWDFGWLTYHYAG